MIMIIIVDKNTNNDVKLPKMNELFTDTVSTQKMMS